MKTKTNEQFFKGYDIFNLGLDAYTIATYFYLCKCKNSNNQCFNSHYNIEINLNCSNTRVKKSLKKLSEIKLITIDHRFNKSKRDSFAQTSNLYTIYPRPQIDIVDSVADVVAEPVEKVITKTIDNSNKHGVGVPKTYELDKTLNNNKPNNNKSINLSSDKQVYSDKQEYDNDNNLQDINNIFQQCNIDAYFLPSQNIVKSCVVNMFCGDQFAYKNKIPKFLVQERLKGLTMQIIDESLANYANKIESGANIYSHNLYFEKILWNSIVSSGLDEYIANVS